ncbi:MAG TPA: hypothetical protein VFS48_06415 [Solirubrobacterales bacterium]|nr:hypothetical protein [Solirubrobacterales bacterium]
MDLSIPQRFNGPLESGNGGYSAGMLARRIDGPAEVSLRSPVPLDTPLEIVAAADGSLRLLDGESLIAQAQPLAELDLSVPAPVSVEAAREASRHYKSPAEGIFSRCFVCGPAREDSLGVFAGPVAGRDVAASPWTPPQWTADDTGEVRPEFVWAVLDCPTYFAAYPGEGMPLSMLVRQGTRIDGPIAAGTEHVVMAWPIETDGRKRHAGAAVLSANGEVLAVSRALLVEPRSE